MDITAQDIRAALSASLNLSGYSEKDREEIILALGGVVLKRALLDLAVATPEHMRDEFLALVEKGESDELGAFVQAHIPDFEAIVRNAVNGEVRKFLDAQAKDFEDEA